MVMNTETDTQAEDTALLMEMDEKVNKRVQECLGRILTQDDDLAEWFIRSIINHPKTTKVIREIVSKQREADILTAAKQVEYEKMMQAKYIMAQQAKYNLDGLANQGMGVAIGSGISGVEQRIRNTNERLFKTQEEIDYQIRTAKALMANAPTEVTTQTPQSLLDKLRGKK